MSAMVTATIIANGDAIPGMFQLLAIDVVKLANKIPYAQLVFVDGSAAEQNFMISASKWFALGAVVEIQLRADGQHNDNLVFAGLVAGQNIQSGAGGSQLIVELIDKSTRLNGARTNALYRQQSSKAVIEQLLRRNDVAIGTLQGAEAVLEQLVQYQSSDWDFLLMRANAAALVVMIDDGAVSAKEINLTATANHQFNYGISACLKFEMQANASQQYSHINAYGWDNNTLLVSGGKPAKNFTLHQGASANLDEIAQAFNHRELELQSMTDGTTLQSKAWAKAAMQQDRLSLFRGTITLAGDPAYKLGDLIDINGVGKLFNGKTLITGVSQIVDENGWRTVLQFGLSPQWHAELYPNVSALPAAGLVPNIAGLQIGVVLKTDNTQDNEHLIPVAIAALRNQDNPNGNLVWARLSTPNAGKKSGVYFSPAAGDEVIVGFLNENPADPIILGAAFSQANPGPEAFGTSDQSPWQGIVTKGNLQLGFDDKTRSIRLTIGNDNDKNTDKNNDLCQIKLNEKQGISISDAFGHQLIFNENAIVVQDAHDNIIKLGKDGIEIQSKKDLTFDTTGNMNFKAAGNIKLNAKMIDLN